MKKISVRGNTRGREDTVDQLVQDSCLLLKVISTLSVNADGRMS